MNEIYLVATAHSDVYGKKRLDNLISKIKPAQICIEADSDSIAECDSRFLENPDKILEEYKAKIGNIRNNVASQFKSNKAIYENSELTEIADLLFYGDVGQRVVGFEFKSPMHHPLRQEYGLHFIDLKYDGEYPYAPVYWKNLIKSNFPSSWENFWLEQDYFSYVKRGFETLMEEHNDRVKSAYCRWEDFEGRNDINRELLPFRQNVSDYEKHIYDPKREEHMAKQIREIFLSSTGPLLAVTGIMHFHDLFYRLEDFKPIAFPLIESDNI
jgi:hypothetical protein